MFKIIASILFLIFSAPDLNSQSVSQEKIAEMLNNYPALELNFDKGLPGMPPSDNETKVPGIYKYPYTSELKNSLNPDNGNNYTPHSNEKIYAYNTKSEKPVGLVSENAIENSNALVSCANIAAGCGNNSPTPTPLPTPVPTAFYPTLTPTPVIVSVTPIPDPIITPIKCYERLCPMIACLDSAQNEMPARFDEECRCPCVPPPIY